MGKTINKSKRIYILFGTILCSLLVSSAYSTQKIAEILEYHPTLGWNLFKIGSFHVYFPFAWIDWYITCRDIVNIQWAFEKYCFDVLYFSLIGSMLVAVLILIMNRKKVYDEHGSAHLATDEDLFMLGHSKDTRKFFDKFKDFFKAIKEFWKSDESLTKSWKTFRERTSGWITNDNDLFSGKGVYLGRLDDGRYIQDNAKTHVLLLAPTRSGKGVGHIVPTLLTWEGSLIVADPKGENWDLTSGYRKFVLGNKVMQFKPMHEDSCKYNPFTEIRITTAKEMGDLQLITKILVDPTGKGFERGDTHWIESADVLLQGVTLHLLYQKRFHNVDKDGNPLPAAIANLSDVLDFLYDGQDGSSKQKPEDVKKEEQHEEPRPLPQMEKKVTKSGKDYQKLSFEDQITQSFLGKSLFREDDEDVEDYSTGEENDYASDEEQKAFEGSTDKAQYVNNLNKRFEKQEEKKRKDIRTMLAGLNFGTDNSDKNASGQNKSDKSGSSKDNPPKIESEFADEEKAGVEGLQKKLQVLLLNAQYIPELDKMSGYRHAPDDDPNLFERLYPDKKSRRGMHPFVRQIFQSMVDKPDKEFGSILSTLDTALAIYRNPILVHNISSSDFVMKDIMDCEKPISLYLVFGPGEIQVIKPLLRVIIEMMWRLNVEELFKHKHRLLMLLDEFPAFGKLEGIEQSAGFTAGYGIKMFIIAQDMNQINKLYDTNNYLVSNCQVQIYHGPSDNNSAKYISEKMGKKTIKATSESRNSNLLPLPNSYNDSLIARDLMTPDEVFRMDPDKLIVFCKGCAPIMANKIKYYSNPDFSEKAKIKPPGHSDKVLVEDRDWKWREYKLLDFSTSKEWLMKKRNEAKKLSLVSELVWILEKRRIDLQYEIDFDCLLLEEKENN